MGRKRLWNSHHRGGVLVHTATSAGQHGPPPRLLCAIIYSNTPPRIQCFPPYLVGRSRALCTRLPESTRTARSVEASHGHPFCRSHLRTARSPPSAAKGLLIFTGSLGLAENSRCPPTAVKQHECSFDGHQFCRGCLTRWPLRAAQPRVTPPNRSAASTRERPHGLPV